MKNIIIGTAGHVDHGKTLLIKALTGIDTDRLKEEKKRGITIELGFAYLDLPGGAKAGVVDVPGHEKFIKNMLAGAGGIDLALLIVAADDGVMPQTREHLGILSLLGIKNGVIALTKTDLCDSEWIEMVGEDVRDLVAGTFLEGAPIIPVSAYTGSGIDRLREALYDLCQKAAEKDTAKPFRLPVDRVFTIEGFGTVVTGTLIEGRLAEGGEVEIYPAQIKARVRSVQVHSRSVGEAYAGQRVAINLAGLKKEDIQRGDTLAAPGSLENTMMVDVKLSVLKDSPRTLLNGTRLHFYHGSRETLCKLVLLEGDALPPGGSAYAQLRFTEDVAAKRGDRFVLRFYSPLETVGGGVILEPNPAKHKRGQESTLTALAVKESGSALDNLLQAVTDASPHFTPLNEVKNRLLLSDEAFQQGLAALTTGGKVVMLGQRHGVSSQYLDKIAVKAQGILQHYHGQNPLLPGMPLAEFRNKLLPGREQPLADKLIMALAQAGRVRLDNQTVALPGFAVVYNDKQKELAQSVAQLYLKNLFQPPEPDEIAAAFPKDKSALKQIIDAMLKEGLLLPATPQLCFHKEAAAQALAIIQREVAEKGEITLAAFRDQAQTSRKYALALLEYFDRQGITKKVGEGRVLLKKP